MTAPFDPTRLAVTGPPIPLTEDVRQSLAPPAFALTIREPGGSDIWIYELTHGRRTRLTDEGNNMFPVWSPDSTLIAFASGRFGHHNLFVQAADGSGPAERLLTSDTVQRPRSWSPDGRRLNFSQDDPMPDIWTLSLEQPPTPRPIVQLPGYQTSSRISPDGRWLAYTSEESGRFETYVTRFPNGGGQTLVSSGGGTQPIWARNGRELFYLKDDKLMVVEVNARSAFVAGTPVLLFQGQSFLGPAGDSTCDVSLDRQRFLMIQTSGDNVTANQVNVVLGWSDELTRRARAGQH